MIESIAFNHVPFEKNAHRDDIPHGAWGLGLPAIAERKGVVTFKPGLNILFGPNGCGKSTVIETIAVHMMAHKNGETAITQDSIMAMMGREASRTLRRKQKATPVAAKVSHDGQPVCFGSSGKLMFGADRSFDTDFMDAYGAKDGIVEGASGTHGSRNLAVNQLAIRTLLGQRQIPDAPAIASTMRRDRVNDVWKAMIDVAMDLLEPSIEKGQKTVLLDEPDAHLSLLMQGRLWRDILGKPDVADRLQVIVASHSPFALAIPHAHVIGMPDEYVRACREELGELSATLNADTRSPSVR